MELKPQNEVTIYTNFTNLDVRHPRCVGSITKNLVYYMYSQTQL